jgi:hypothetical protein
LRDPLWELGLYVRDQGVANSDFEELDDPLGTLRGMPDLPVHLRVRRDNAAIAAFLVLMLRPEAIQLRERLEAELETLR